MGVEKKKVAGVTPVVARLPEALVRRLDKVAGENGRSRSSEVRVRLAESFARRPAIRRA